MTKPKSGLRTTFLTMAFVLALAAAAVFYLPVPVGGYAFLGRNHYLQENVSPAKEFADQPALPDLSRYTEGNVLRRMPEVQKGRIEVANMEGAAPLRKFAFDKRLSEARQIQGRISPKAIHIYSGVYDMAALLEAITDERYLQNTDAGYLVRVPIAVYPGATLILKNLRKPVLLSQDKGGFLVSAGKLFIIGTKIYGWNEGAEAPARLNKNVKQFRPFITTWDGSEIYIVRSRLAHLGYALSKSYGLTVSTSDVVQEEFINQFGDLAPPTGWLIDSHFKDFYYGFYSYEAEDVALVNNRYEDNIVYGIDPHDRSKRLIIARNHVTGTHKKHGIIISREVNDSFIFGNLTERNAGSGIMLDRLCERNVIADNVSRLNGGDGITFYESPYNWTQKNVIERNSGSGIRIRNSWNIFSQDDTIRLNSQFAFELYQDTLTATGRDFAMDPVTLDSAAVFRNTQLDSNGGILKVKGMRSVQFEGVNFQGAALKSTEFAGEIANIPQPLLQKLGSITGAFAIRAYTHQARTIGAKAEEAAKDCNIEECFEGY